MNTLRKLSLLLLLLFGTATLLQAQTKEERKDAQKLAKKSAVKDARKQAKKYAKQGYSNLPGGLPMEKQIENTMILSYVVDEKGTPKYYVAQQEAKAETFAAAKQQAQQLCLADIAAQIGSNIIGRIKSDVANAESKADAASVTEVIGAYQNTVMAKLGRTEPVLLFKRTDKKQPYTYIVMAMKYDMASAEEMVKNDLRKELKQKTNLMQEEIDQMLKLND